MATVRNTCSGPGPYSGPILEGFTQLMDSPHVAVKYNCRETTLVVKLENILENAAHRVRVGGLRLLVHQSVSVCVCVSL